MAGVTGGVHTAIVLQDGGALGVYECGVRTAIREQRPGLEPVAVTGISICAVTAAVPGGARTDPVSTLEPSGRSGSPSRLLPGGSSDRSTVRSPSSATPGTYRPSTAPDRAVAGDEHLVDLGEPTGDGSLVAAGRSTPRRSWWSTPAAVGTAAVARPRRFARSPAGDDQPRTVTALVPQGAPVAGATGRRWPAAVRAGTTRRLRHGTPHTFAPLHVHAVPTLGTSGGRAP